jgi:hypothetical protein
MTPTEGDRMAKEKPIDERLDEVREDDGQVYVDRDVVDFDPDDGLLSGTAIDGTSDIPGSEDSDEGAQESADGGQDAAQDEAGDEHSDESEEDTEGSEKSQESRESAKTEETDGA